MKFRTENEFTHFKFSDVHVSDIMMSFGTFKICLDNVIIKADNSKNRDIRDMRTNGLILKLSDANIISFIREGFKTYDADESECKPGNSDFALFGFTFRICFFPSC